jgi:hypothetical protein
VQRLQRGLPQIGESCAPLAMSSEIGIDVDVVLQRAAAAEEVDCPTQTRSS